MKHNIIISLVLALSGAATSSSEASLIGPRYNVYADARLNKESRIALNASLKEWNKETGSWVKFSLTYVDFFQDQDNAIYIIQGNPKVKGAIATTNVLPFQRNSSIIILSPQMRADHAKQVILHELGHAMKLRFDGEDHYKGLNKSVMFSYVEDSAGSIQCVDKLAFCETWKCKSGCEK